MKRHGDVKMAPFIVIRDHQTRMTFSHKLLGKSTTDEDYSRYVVHAVMKDLKSLDYKKIVLKSDQEKALVALQERLRQLRNGINEQTILENSPVGESQSNGVVEKAVQEVENLAGTLLAALEERLDIVLPIESAVFAWLIDYSSVLINTYRVGKDGQTPTQRHKVIKHHRAIAEFGESVFFLPLDRESHPIPALEAKFQQGIWLGLDQRTEEVIIGTPSGIVKCRSVRRRPEPERWTRTRCLRFVGRLGSRRRELTRSFFEQQFDLRRMPTRHLVLKFQLPNRALELDGQICSRPTLSSTGTRRDAGLAGHCRRTVGPGRDTTMCVECAWRPSS